MSRGEAATAVLLAALTLLPACTRRHTFERPPVHVNPNMDFQEKLVPQSASDFFADGASMRPKLAGTVAREDPLDVAVTTGIDAAGNYLAAAPLPLDAAALERGAERYTIYCSPCHGAAGDGQGMLTRRAGIAVTSLLDPRLEAAPDGEFVHVMEAGLGLMPSYRAQVAAADRWAIVAHVRELQQAAREAAATAVLPEAAPAADAEPTDLDSEDGDTVDGEAPVAEEGAA